MTVHSLLTEWLEICEKDNIKARTYSRYRGLIDTHIAPALGDRDITEINQREVQQFLMQERETGNIKNGGKLSAVSTNMMLGVLDLAYEYACDMEYIEMNPCTRVRRRKIEPKKIDAFTVEEQRAIEAEIAQNGDSRLHGILICLYTGLRIGELLSLTWNDVDTESGLIYVNKTVYQEKKADGSWQLCTDTPKTRSSDRVIPMPAYLTEILVEDKKHSQSDYVISNKKNEQMPVRSYQYMFERLTERIGIRKLNFHALRHTFATRAIECGIDIKTISEILGHKNASITLNRYAHCMYDHKKQMMQKLPRIL